MKEKYYENFKNILEYFVAHLEHIQNDENTDTIGYEKYIKPLKEKNSFSKTGIGYKGDNIQNAIKDWAKFGTEDISINIQNNPKAKYTSKACYLNWIYTGLNVVAKWKNILSKMEIKKELI